jgi:hypothetical protein
MSPLPNSPPQLATSLVSGQICSARNRPGFWQASSVSSRATRSSNFLCFKIPYPLGMTLYYHVYGCANDMTKCVATAVMRNSGSSERSCDTIWSKTASSRLGSKLRDLTHPRKRSHGLCTGVEGAVQNRAKSDAQPFWVCGRDTINYQVSS